MITLTRNTYPMRKELKNYGATWNPATRAWTMSTEDWEEFRESYPIHAAEMAPATPKSTGGDPGDINTLLRNHDNAAAAE